MVLIKNTSKKKRKTNLEVIGPISHDIVNYTLNETYLGCCGNVLPFATGLFYGHNTDLNIVSFDVFYKFTRRSKEFYNGIPVKLVDRKIEIKKDAADKLKFAVHKRKFENVLIYEYEDGLIDSVFEDIVNATKGRVFVATRNPGKYVNKDVTIICNNFEFVADVVITNADYVKTFSVHKNKSKVNLYHHFGLGDVFAYFYAKSVLEKKGIDWVQKTVSEVIYSIPVRIGV